MIESATQFARLRLSDDRAEQARAAREPMANEAMWQEVLTRFPDLTIWVVRNKSVPLAVLADLARHADPRIRREVACKRKLDSATIALLEADNDENVRHQIAQTNKQKEATP